MEARERVSEDATRALLADGLADPETGWTLGGFGALAAFGRAADEPVTTLSGARFGLRTPRGGLGLIPRADVVPIAYETAFAGGWSHAVALCVPAAACPVTRPGVVREIGVDAEALCSEAGEGVLFDLGLGQVQGAVFLRAYETEGLAGLRALCGARAFGSGSPVPAWIAAHTYDLVFTTPVGRIEIFARRDGALQGPGPRGFFDPRLLASPRTHAATAPIPAGLVPCATLHPPHPCRDATYGVIAFRPERHAAFQALYARWGDAAEVALKAHLRAGGDLPAQADRRARAVARVVRVQAEAMRERPRDV